MFLILRILKFSGPLQRCWQNVAEFTQSTQEREGAREVIKVSSLQIWSTSTSLCAIPKSHGPLKAVRRHWRPLSNQSNHTSCGLEVVPDDSSSGECSPEQMPQEVAAFLPVAEDIDLRCQNGGACRLCIKFSPVWGAFKMICPKGDVCRERLGRENTKTRGPLMLDPNNCH